MQPIEQLDAVYDRDVEKLSFQLNQMEVVQDDKEVFLNKQERLLDEEETRFLLAENIHKREVNQFNALYREYLRLRKELQTYVGLTQRKSIWGPKYEMLSNSVRKLAQFQKNMIQVTENQTIK